MMEKEAVLGKCKLDTVYRPKTRKKMEKTEKVKSFMENTTVIPNIMYNFASKSNRS